MTTEKTQNPRKKVGFSAVVATCLMSSNIDEEIAKAKADLPSGWIVKKSNSRPDHFYYLHKESGKKTWKRKEMLRVASKITKEKKLQQKMHKYQKKQEKVIIPGQPQQVQALHILVKHCESRRPASWRQDPITRTKEDALKEIGKIREEVKSLPYIISNINTELTVNPELRKKFEQIAEERSDCSSAKRGGDLGMFKRGKMQPSFEKASFALKIGELSDIVSTGSGYHIILRIK